ncbi:MAG: transketolase, partial [Myxococcota bacterium]
MSFSEHDRLCVNTLRTLAIDTIERANSGHPGLPLGAAPMAYVLWQRHLRHDPGVPAWPNRDRFVLSAGHGSALLYALLHVYGYDLTLADLRSFRQWQSRTPGHPEFGFTPGVEATTGPLGQGAANAVGMAIAERALAHLFNRPGYELFDHRTYALVGDGDLMEGVAYEAASLAGHLKLDRLTFLYDSNDISLDGPTSLTFTENVAQRFDALGWHVLRVEDGNRDLAAIDRALDDAKAEHERPTLIIVRTTIGFGSPKKAGTSGVHGSPLGPDEVKHTKAQLGWSESAEFFVPDAARAHFATRTRRASEEHHAWNALRERYHHDHPELDRALERALAGEVPTEALAALPTFTAGESLATRQAGGKALTAVASKMQNLLGGDADLSGSTGTAIKDGGSFEGVGGAGRNLHFGVREHAMGAIANGIVYHGGLRPYVATFFVFSDYMRPAVRLAAMGHLPVIYVWTHDSIALGEDGPTHQPVEHLAALRAIPNLTVIRPADANETSVAWRCALEHRTGPVALVLTRQKVPTLDRTHLGSADLTARGAYVLADSPKARAILIATGS